MNATLGKRGKDGGRFHEAGTGPVHHLVGSYYSLSGSRGTQNLQLVALLRAFSELLICMLHQFGLGYIKNGAL